MNRRSYLGLVAGAGTLSLAGCSSPTERFYIQSISGLEDSKIFEGVHFKDPDASIGELAVTLTEAATVEHGVEELITSSCIGDGEFVGEYEDDVDLGQTTVTPTVGCPGKVFIVAYDNVDSPVDDLKLIVKKVEDSSN